MRRDDGWRAANVCSHATLTNSKTSRVASLSLPLSQKKRKSRRAAETRSSFGERSKIEWIIIDTLQHSSRAFIECESEGGVSLLG